MCSSRRFLFAIWISHLKHNGSQRIGWANLPKKANNSQRMMKISLNCDCTQKHCEQWISIDREWDDEATECTISTLATGTLFSNWLEKPHTRFRTCKCSLTQRNCFVFFFSLANQWIQIGWNDVDESNKKFRITTLMLPPLHCFWLFCYQSLIFVHSTRKEKETSARFECVVFFSHRPQLLLLLPFKLTTAHSVLLPDFFCAVCCVSGRFVAAFNFCFSHELWSERAQNARTHQTDFKRQDKVRRYGHAHTTNSRRQSNEQTLSVLPPLHRIVASKQYGQNQFKQSTWTVMNTQPNETLHTKLFRMHFGRYRRYFGWDLKWTRTNGVRERGKQATTPKPSEQTIKTVSINRALLPSAFVAFIAGNWQPKEMHCSKFVDSLTPYRALSHLGPVSVLICFILMANIRLVGPKFDCFPHENAFLVSWGVGWMLTHRNAFGFDSKFQWKRSSCSARTVSMVLANHATKLPMFWRVNVKLLHMCLLSSLAPFHSHTLRTALCGSFDLRSSHQYGTLSMFRCHFYWNVILEICSYMEMLWLTTTVRYRQ